MIRYESSVNDLFQVFAAYGLAAILEETRQEMATIFWDTEGTVNIECGGATIEDGAAAVKKNAARIAGEFWLQAHIGSGASGKAVLSPRGPKFPTDADYMRFQRERWGALDQMERVAQSEWRFVGALGEPSYRWIGNTRANPDLGASAWEMKTRNRGEEVLQDRVAPLARSVGARDLSAVKNGLLGSEVLDEVGKDAADSRTPTGLRPPGPTDNAQAWCALMGLGLTTVRPAAPGQREQRPRSATLGAIGRGRSTWFYVPIPTRPVTLSRVRSIFRSESLRLFAERSIPSSSSHPMVGVRQDEETERESRWLGGLGIGGVVLAKKHFTESKAPESWAVPQFFLATGPEQ